MANTQSQEGKSRREIKTRRKNENVKLKID